MGIEFLKNPIVLGAFAAILAYIYFHWKADQEHKKNPSGKKKRPNFLIPGIVGIIVWFFASSYLDNSNPKVIQQEAGYIDPPTPVSNTVANKIMDSEIATSSHSYHCIGKNKVRFPPTDVFIDIAKF